MSDLDLLAIDAKNNESSMNKLIIQYENFILRCASSSSRRYISKSDDEWSIALSAFTEAVINYSSGKGSFLNFAELVIKRRMIDFMRSRSRHDREVSVNPSVFDADGHDEEEHYIQTDISKKLAITDDNPLKLEITIINEVFSGYGFSFMDLAKCSPKADKTKRSCAKAVAYLLNNPILINEMKVTKRLPLNIIEKSLKLSRKSLERHRKYIIAAVEIMSGDYPNLAVYMKYIREELEK